MASLTDIITRKYNNFRGVDFTGGIVSYFRSPDALNMWRDYKDDDCVQTRPGMTLLDTFSGEIFGLFFLTKNNIKHCLVHAGVKLYEWDNYPLTPASITEKFTGMNPTNSKSFIYNDILFIIDGINYLEYDGTSVTKVEGTIPYTSYYRNPDGSSNMDADTDVDTVYQPVNLIQPKRINRFIADGVSRNYHLDTKELDSAATFLMTGSVNGIAVTENIEFSVDRTDGIVTFFQTYEQGTIITITLSKTTPGYGNKILNCTLCAEFDSRIFFAGNPDYPNMVFHAQLEDPRYFADILQNECGVDLAMVKAIVPGNNVLWVIKEIEQSISSVHYLTPTYDTGGNKCYSDVSGSIALGCVSTGINFNDDVVFFSKKGMEGIKSSSLYSEQLLTHRSSLVDTKMINESTYESMKLAEWKGYLLCLVNSHIYLADSRQMFTSGSNEMEYEWYYWELHNNITFMREYEGILYLGNANGDIFKLNGIVDETNDDNEEVIIPEKGQKYYPIHCYWSTKKEDFDYPGYTKTTNKRGNVANVKVMDNTNIQLDTIVDGLVKYKNVYSDAKGYFPYRIKDKKFKEIQLKFSSNKPFGLFSCTLEGFIAGYIKR